MPSIESHPAESPARDAGGSPLTARRASRAKLVAAPDKWRDLGDVGAVGIEFVVAIALCYGVGHWLDGRYFGNRGWATAIGAALGVITAFKAIFDAHKRMKLRLAKLERDEALARAAAAPEPWERRRDDGRRGE